MKKIKLKPKQSIELKGNGTLLYFEDDSGADDLKYALKGCQIIGALSQFYMESLRRRRKYSELNKSEREIIEQLVTEFFNCLKAWECDDLLT